MKNVEKIKEDLIAFGKRHSVWEEILNSIKGDSLTELFANIGKYIYRCRDSKEKEIEFNSIFDNELVIEDGVLLCCCSNLESIIIPNSVTSIGDYAFYYCRELTSVTIPNSVTSIGDSAFHFCSGLTSVTIPNSVTSIGDSAFRFCTRLTLITIPNSITSIGEGAFAYCRELTSIKIPNSVTSIGNNVFKNCNPELEIIRK